MASAGVVGMAEVVSPNATISNDSISGTPAMWSMIWFGAALLFLIFVHMAIAGR